MGRFSFWTHGLPPMVGLLLHGCGEVRPCGEGPCGRTSVESPPLSTPASPPLERSFSQPDGMGGAPCSDPQVPSPRCSVFDASSPDSSSVDGGPSSSPPPVDPPAPPRFYVEGTITGPHGSGLRLGLDGTIHLDISEAETVFRFPSSLPQGTPFEVRVERSPEDSWCRTEGGLGTTGRGSESKVHIRCQAFAKVRQLAAGHSHTCALLEDQTVRCWGSNDWSQLGGSSFDTSIPGLSRVVQVDAGGSTTCVVLEGGTVRCWGLNWDMPTGWALDSENGSFGSTTENLPGLTGAVEVSVGYRHTCVRLVDGGVRCWGASERGQTGWFDRAHPNGSLTENVPGLSGIVAVRAGSLATCVARRDGAVLCFGSIRDAAFATPEPLHPVPDLPLRHEVPGIHGLEVADHEACARLDDGTVRCWGADTFGQAAGSSPTQSIPGLSGVQGIALGSGHLCALGANGKVRCWGKSESGQRGGSSPGEEVEGVSDALQVVAGDAHTCARLRSGAVRCWGENRRGQGGRVPRDIHALPLKGVVSVSAGETHSCARWADGSVRCWGSHESGEAATGSLDSAITGLSGVGDIVAGCARTCSLMTNGTVRCWGTPLFSHPTLGSGIATIPGLSGVVQLGLGADHVCAVLANRSLRCWGDGFFGQTGWFGPDNSDVYGTSEASIPDVEGVQKVATGLIHTCVLLAKGQIACWGNNYYGQTGSPDRDEATLAHGETIPLSDTDVVADVVAGARHTCLQMSDHTVRCFGSNDYGQVAGSDSTRSIPGLSAVRLLSTHASGDFTCALLDTGSVRCWGRRDGGETAGASVSRSVEGLERVRFLSAGRSHVLVLTEDGKVYGWGDDSRGQLSGVGPRITAVPLLGPP